MNDVCSIELLTNAVANRLSEDEEAALYEHLERCEACCARMEQLAGGEQWQQEAASLLTTDELDAAVPEPMVWSEVDFSVEHLEPSEDANVLGQLGGYEVLAIIGRGGMGVVLKAFDRELKRLVAIKVLAPHLAHSSVARKRFAREAQAAAAVVNPHVIAIHHVQPTGRLPFLIMPLLTGESLAQRLKSRAPLELTEVLRIGMQAAVGLAAAHDQGLVHRDVKPANIFLEKGVERVVITDFGLARAADDVSMTRLGVVAGTPEYMSPEQARGEALDGRSDLFSLGCVLYEMATGVSPFRSDSTIATLRRIVDDKPAAIASLAPELPPWFSYIVERLLSKDPAQRFASASEVALLLEQCLAHVQQPTSVSLPASVVPDAKGRRSIFNSTRKGVIAMLGTMTWIIKNRRVLWISTVVVALGVILCVALLNGLARENRVFDGSLRPVTESSRDSRLPDQWRVELEIPDSDLARIRSHVNSDEDIDVEFVAVLAPTSSFRGKLRLVDLQTKLDNLNISVASVRIHSIDGDIPERQLIPPKLLLPGAKIQARIHFENSP